MPCARPTRATSSTASTNSAAAVFIGPDRTDRQPRGAGERRERREVGELLPDRLLRVGNRLRVDVGAEHGLLDRTDAIGVTARAGAEVLAEHDAPVGAGLRE